MKHNSSSLPVLVLNAGHHGALGIARSLGRLGAPVYTLAAQWCAPAFYSRYSRGKLEWNLKERSPAQTVEFLLEFARKHLWEKALLIPTCDGTAAMVAEHSAALGESYRFPVQSPELIHSLASKKEMYFLCKHFGIPTPETQFPRSVAEVNEFAATAHFPVMVKAVEVGLVKPAGKTKIIAGSRQALLDAYASIHDPHGAEVMLQEYIPGKDDAVWMFNGYFDARSECLFGLTGRKLRQFPVYTGVTSLGICLRNDCVAETTKRFMKAVGYRGILDIGYRFDARDGQYKLLDVNPRIGATFRLFVDRSGMDVARALYLDMTGRAVPPAGDAEGRKWVVEDFDLVSSVRYLLDGQLTPGAWIRSLRGVREGAVWAMDDPLPVLARAIHSGSELWARRAARTRQGTTVRREGAVA